MTMLSQRVEKCQNMCSAFQRQSLGISELVSSTSEGGSWKLLFLIINYALVAMKSNSMHG